MSRPILWVSTMVLVALSLNTSFAIASGGRSDGGGNVVVCFKSSAQKQKVQKHYGVIEDSDLENIESIDLLEIYDMKVHYAPLRGRELFMPKSDSEVTEAQSVFEYSKKNIAFTSDPFLAPTFNVLEKLDKAFNSVLEGIVTHQSFLNQPLRRQYDSNEVVNYDVNDRCILSTLAIQAGDSAFFELTIDERLWSHPKFSILNKVALIFHETFYRMDRNSGAENSLRAQRTTQMFLSTLKNETKSQWLNRVSQYGIIGGQSPDVMYANRLYSRGYFFAEAEIESFLIPKGTSHDKYVQSYVPAIQKIVKATRTELAKLDKQYAINQDFTAKVDQILDGFSKLDEKTHNAYVEAELGLNWGKYYPNVTEWFSKIPGFDLFQKY